MGEISPVIIGNISRLILSDWQRDERMPTSM
jgi:hypothetical protein